MRGAGALGSITLLLLGACGGPELAPPPPPRISPPPTAALVATAAPTASVAPAPAEEIFEEEATPEDAERVLFLATDLRTDGIRMACPVTLAPRPRIRCLLGLRFADEPESRKLALTLYAETGSLAGLLPEETSDDGRGGKVHLLPARPIGKNRDHLEWIVEAFRDYRTFLELVRVAAALRTPTAGKVAFRDRPVDFRFFYSETGGNPSAFAIRRNVGYNLYGTVNVSDVAVRDTLFHEIFHLNDARLGDALQTALQPLYAGILARCGKKKACLTPYSPTDTFVNGAFYAFSLPGSPREYAAELGLRYYREHRLVMKKEPLPVTAFKCGPPENKQAWRLVADAMFGGVDLVPACPEPAKDP